MPVLDEDYGGVLDAHLPDVLGLLKPDNTEETRAAFLADPTKPPHLTYRSRLDKFDFNRHYRALYELVDRVLTKHRGDLANLYVPKIKEAIDQLALLEATRGGEDFKAHYLSQVVYGIPSEFALRTALGTFAKHSTSVRYIHPAVASAVAALTEACYDRGINPIDPEPQLRKLGIPVKKDMSGEPFVTHEEIVSLFNVRLERDEAPGWSLIVDESGDQSGIMANTAKRAVIIPRADIWGNKERRSSATLATIEHEMTHAQRAANGRQKLHILERGLAHNFEMEEGVATWIERTMLGADDFPGYFYTLAIALARGTFDGVMRAFHEVFALLKAAYFLKGMYSDPSKDTEAALRVATNNAYTTCIRVFRGTTGETQGACLTKDCIYRNGAVGLWPMFANNELVRSLFYEGEFDPTSETHTGPLTRLGIISPRS